MQASTPIDEVRGILLDATGTAYQNSELLTWLNEALRATSNVKRDFYVKQGAIDLVAGVVQELPSDGLTVIDLIYNNHTGKVCTQCDMELLQESNRFWPADDPQENVENWAINPKNPRRFYVTPPNTGGSGVALMGSYGAVPPEITDVGDDLSVTDDNQPILVNFMLARAYSKSSKRYDPTKEAFYFNEWKQLVGLKSTSQIAIAPKVSESPGK